MQLTNGVIKKSAPAPMPPGAAMVQEPKLEDLDSFDLSAFIMPSATGKQMSLRPSDKDKAKTEIDNILKESEDLFNLGVKYETEVVARGHQSLYELLASIYSLALRIEASDNSEKIVTAIRKNLKEKHDIKLQTNSTPMAAIVRYVVRSDKLVASRYTKVLNVARLENLSPEELPAYITRRGGVTQIQETEAIALSKKKGEKNTKARTALLREYFQLLGYSSQENFKYSGEVLVHNEEKQTAAETSSFCVIVAHHVGGEDYKIVTANDLGHTFEDNLIKFMGKEFPEDLYTLERGIRNFKRKLSMDLKLSEGFRKEMERQLGSPMKHKQQEVLEMQAPDQEESN